MLYGGIVRILWITPSMPCQTTGNRVRQFNLIKQLSCQHKITVLSFVQDFEVAYVDLLRQYTAEVITIPLQSPPLPGRWVNRLQSWWRLLLYPSPRHIHIYPIPRLCQELRRMLKAQSFDLLHVETLHPVQLVDHRLAERVLLVEQNIESAIQFDRFALTKGTLPKLREWVEWRKLLRYEKAQLGRIRTVATVSEVDAARCRTLAPKTSVYVVPNGVDVNWFAPPPEFDAAQRQGLVFAGAMDYEPNIDGAKYFCHEIWPLIRQAQPGVSLTIAGARPTSEVLALGDLPGVTVTGFVEDMRPYLWQAAVSVVPLRMGGGTRLKILESMAAGCAVVSTSLGAEGLHFNAGKELLVADSAERFALSIIELLDNPERRVEMVRLAHQIVAYSYDWAAIAPRLAEVYRSMMLRGKAITSPASIRPS